MKAVVLVGGEGTRLRPLTLSTPKQMLPIVGVPMIERVLAHLASHGVDEAVLSLGYLPDAFTSAYPGGEASGVRLVYAVEPSPLDTAGAIRFAAQAGGVDEPFVVLNGDVLTDFDIIGLIGFHRSQRAEATIGLHPVPDPSPFGVVPTDDEGRVTAFIEKPPPGQAPTNLINAGIYVLDPSVLGRIPTGRRVSIERETFPAMVDEGALYARGDDSYWLDTGTPGAFLQAHRDLCDGTRGDEAPSPGAHRKGDLFVSGQADLQGTVTGPGWIGPDVAVAAGGRVERSWLGAGCTVEAGATVLDTVLMAGVRVAADASLEGSIVGPGATVGQRCRIRPISVLGGGVVVPSGTVVDGARLPE